MIPTCVIRVTVLKSNVLILWIFSQEFILLVTPREGMGVLAVFVYRGMHAIFGCLKLPLKTIFCLKFATWISHLWGKNFRQLQISGVSSVIPQNKFLVFKFMTKIGQ